VTVTFSLGFMALCSLPTLEALGLSIHFLADLESKIEEGPESLSILSSTLKKLTLSLQHRYMRPNSLNGQVLKQFFPSLDHITLHLHFE